MSFSKYIQEQLSARTNKLLVAKLNEMHDAPDQMKYALSKDEVENMLGHFDQEEDYDIGDKEKEFMGDVPEVGVKARKYDPVTPSKEPIQLTKDDEIATLGTLGIHEEMIPNKKDAAAAFGAYHYNTKHGTNFSKQHVHGYLFGNSSDDFFHDHISANYNTEDPAHIKQAFGFGHDHPSLNEEQEESQEQEAKEVDMDDIEQLHSHVHNAISSGYDLQLELADGSVVYVDPHQLQHFHNKNALPEMFASLGSAEDFQNYLDYVYTKQEPTAKHGPDPDPYKDMQISPDKAMEVHDRPDPVMESLKGVDKIIKDKPVTEAELSHITGKKDLATVQPGEPITITVPKKGLVTGKIKEIRGDKAVVVDQEGNEHVVVSR